MAANFGRLVISLLESLQLQLHGGGLFDVFCAYLLAHIGVGAGGGDREIGPPLLGLGIIPPLSLMRWYPCSCMAISAINKLAQNCIIFSAN